MFVVNVRTINNNNKFKVQKVSCNNLVRAINFQILFDFRVDRTQKDSQM